MSLKLQCSNDDFDALHEALDRVRSSSQTVKVDKGALRRLLNDHAALIREVRSVEHA